MERVFKRLDRGLANAEWRRRYMNARVDILPRVNSDHHPLLVNLTPGMRLLGERPFRFEVMWKTHPSFNEFIEKTWTNDTPLPRALESLTEALKSWNLEVFGNVFRKKRTILNRLAGIQKAPTYGRNPHLEKLERDLSRELDQILNQEELLWLQKSRQQWIVDGDRNMKFYHTKTAIRRRKNRILKLRRGDGSWCEEQQELKDMAVSFYSSLYKEESTDYLSLDLPISYPVMKDEHKAALLKQPNNEEIHKAIFHIGSLKAPGEDGFPAYFYKENWSMVKDSVCSFIKRIWENPEEIREINQTLITLIPKIDQPEFISQFRPIALCNVVYKCISKLLVERIKPTLHDRISPNQSSFVPGRVIHDNVIIAKEMIHDMKRMKGKKKFMAIKIDFAKAYDCLRWSFVDECIAEFGIGGVARRLIKECINSVTYKILWNGGKTDIITPTRGLRQGDPLSPYLFVIAMDKLSHFIEDLVDKGDWKPMRAGREGPFISHLLFADDLILFSQASVDQIEGILRALNRFGQVSGLKINAEKTAIVFSKNVEERLRNQISNISGFQEQSNLGKYLGAMISDNRKKKDNFKTTLDRVKNKLGGWKMNCLSMAGRITLAKAVISPILNYDMMHTQVPKGICKEVERIQRSFIWGDGRESRKVHAISWETICKPIKEGGLGFRKLSKMNEAFLQKIIWRLVMEKESLWAQVMLSKYGRGQDLRQNILSKQSDSDLWRSLAKVWGFFKDNIEFSIGNRRRIRLWIDPWLKNEGSLIQKAIIPIEEENMEITLTEATDLNGGWDFNLLRRYLPDNIIYKIQAIHPPWDNLKEDKILWSLTPTGEFSIASTYRKISQQTDTQDRIWEVLWGWKGPQKIKIFMWLTLHRKLMTVTYWWLWRWRNCEIFSPPFRRPIDTIATIFQTTNSINEAFKKEELFCQKKRRVEIEVAWKPPVEGWIKFNSDGVSNEKGSGCGGLARDHWGRWVAGFMANLGTCSAFQAELWGVCYALKTAWDLEFKRVELEVDARAVYEAITKGRRLNQHPNNLIRSINIWLKKQWSVEIRHTYREGNQAADWLAKKSVKERGTGYCFIDSPFVDLRSILDADMKGASLPRCVINL
ncbi:hypothetical protein AHAS_Ahas15G0025100 [Arachis hypogaea]